MEELLMNIANIAPVVGVLIWVVIHFRGEIKAKDKEILELNKELRAADKDNLTALLKVTAFMDKMVDKIDNLKGK